MEKGGNQDWGVEGWSGEVGVNRQRREVMRMMAIFSKRLREWRLEKTLKSVRMILWRRRR
jgi:hypothetical protein